VFENLSQRFHVFLRALVGPFRNEVVGELFRARAK
jgi:hypothetical protein